MDLKPADFNDDTRLDLAVASYGSDDFRVFVGNGSGTFTPALSPYIYPLGRHATALKGADLNGDGRLDLVALYGYGRVYLGNGDATFDEASAYALNSLLAARGDFDFDGRVDLVGDSGLGTTSAGLARLPETACP